MQFLVVVSALISLTASSSPPTATFHNSSQWLQGLRLVTSLVDGCTLKLRHLNMSQVSGMKLCLKVKAFQSLDRALSQDIIPLGQAMELVRDRTTSDRRLQTICEECVCFIIPFYGRLQTISEECVCFIVPFYGRLQTIYEECVCFIVPFYGKLQTISEECVCFIVPFYGKLQTISKECVCPCENYCYF
uniref:Uncharacterized protein n=1 Tax=Timema genevievae TaxID=629358 RepID=A0A7R9K756_TIMGE|nr:unnamed protein product [Timema genevievae]